MKGSNKMKKILIIGVAFAATAYSTIALAAISYSYENDGKTLVVTVDSGTNWLQDDEYQAAMNANTVTNLIKRGSGSFGVNGTAQQFTGDVRIENGEIQLRATNPLGAKGRIYIPEAKSLVIGAGNATTKSTIGKDIVTESTSGSDGSWTGYERKIYVWAGDNVVNGKLLFGNRRTWLRAYAGATMTFNGGVGDLDTGGWPYFQPSGGATFVFTSKPCDCNGTFVIQSQTASYPVDAKGFAGHFVFDAARNRIPAIGASNDRVNFVELKTTVDYAFDNGSMSMHFGHNSVFDLFGTEQRVGQMSAATLASGENPCIVTNSVVEPATLHMGMIWGSTSTIRFGGNLSVVFENNIYDTNLDCGMTATGDLIIKGNGTGNANLNFLSNGSWANATNVVVEGVGKIKIANPNALGRKANVYLASNSSLEISSGVTVNVRTLTVGGVQKPRGDYTFGSGTLHVSHPCGFQMSVK